MQKDNIIIADCSIGEVEPFANAMCTDEIAFSIKSHIANWKRTGKLSELKRYATYFFVAFRYFLKRKNYNYIIGWQQFYALIFGFFSWLFKVEKHNTVVALNFTYKGKAGKKGKLYLWFMKKCLETGYIDFIHVPSNEYAYIIANSFNFSINKIIVSPFGINDPYKEYSALAVPNNAPTKYALAIGRSNRDYNFLIDAWEDIEYPLVIISDTYTKDNRGNKKITILNNIAGEESYPWIAHCNAMVIPIDDGKICSGDTVLLTALAMQKKVLVTAPSTLAEMYIENENNGLIVKKDVQLFGEVIKDLLFSDKYDALQQRARESYLQSFSRESMGRQIIKYIVD